MNHAPKSLLLDLTGLFCPAVVLRIKEAVDSCPPGTLVEVTSTDPLSVVDVPLFVRKGGHSLLSSSADLNTFCFAIRTVAVAAER